MQVDGRLVFVMISPHVSRLLAIRPGRYLTAESFVGALLPRLLVGVRVREYTAFRITRSLRTDRGGKPVRLEVERGSSEGLVVALAARLGVHDGDVHRLRSSLAMGAALAVEPGPYGLARRPVTQVAAASRSAIRR
jgi:polyphosphate kinase